MTISTDLNRTIGFCDGSAIVVRSVVGGGIFRTPSSIGSVLQDPMLILALWVGTGLLCLCRALTLAELLTNSRIACARARDGLSFAVYYLCRALTGYHPIN